MSEFAIFEVQGGIGKHVAFTAVLDAYKKHRPETKTIVVSAWPEVFTNNPDVDRLYRLGSTPYFYADYICGKDTEVWAQEPYRQASHIHKKMRLAETWCDMINVPFDNNQPKLILNGVEIDQGRIPYSGDKPLLVFQPFGGPGKDHQSTPYSWMRDIHPTIAQQLVDVFSQKFQVVHICYDFHPQLNNVIRIDQQMPKKVLFAILLHAQKHVLIDSSLQHACAAFGISANVLWVATQPEIFGYDIHTNHKPTIELPKGTVDSYLYDYNFTGSIHECPYSNFVIHDYQKLIDSVLA